MDNSSAMPVAPKPAGRIPPSFQELRYAFLKAILIIASIIGFFVVITDISSTSSTYIWVVLLAYAILLVGSFAPIPYTLRAGILLGLLFLLGSYTLLGTGILGYAPLYFLAFMVLAAFLFDWKAYAVALALSLVVIAAAGWYLTTGRIYLRSNEVVVGSSTLWIYITLVMVVISLILEEGWRRLRKEFIISQLTLKNAMNTLASERANLERTITERTVELTTSAEVSNLRAERLKAVTEIMAGVTSIPEMDELLTSICKSIGEHFNLYYTGIYLNDTRSAQTELQASYGVNSERMLTRGHRLKLGQAGIIGTVASTGEPHVSGSTKDDMAFDPRPELPDTRSLIALPLIVNQRIIGVLDMESSLEGGLSSKDLEVMITLANQVAVTIENARISNETRRALSEARVVYGQYMREAWEQISGETQKVGYRFESTKVKPIENPLDLPEINSVLETGQTVTPSEGNKTITIPLRLRDQVIGVLDVRSNNPDRKWNEYELGLVNSVAERLALALENARLFEETTRRADRERTVSEITNRIRSTNDPQVMLKTALDELKHALGARDVKIRPYSPAVTEQKDQ